MHAYCIPVKTVVLERVQVRYYLKGDIPGGVEALRLIENIFSHTGFV